jgi:hypothetical protein
MDAHSQAGPAVQAASDGAHGLVAEAQAAQAAGVVGTNDHADGVGVDAHSQAGIALRGLSTSGTALYADTLGGRAVDASTFDQTEPAIAALAAVTPAVDAKSFGVGVEAFGVTGVSAATLSAPDPSDPKVGSGVFAFSNAGDGVRGSTLGGTGVRGVGWAQAGAWAGVFEGNVWINGVLFKQVSLFSIDHPLDPEHKLLRHAAVEAPEYKTFYDGIVTLDERGAAVVRMPAWFDALNGDARYQLTALDRAAPDLHVARPLSDGEFQIAGGHPRQRVSWQVTGVRRDAWAQANPLPLEAPKATGQPRLTSSEEIERVATEVRGRAEQIRAEGERRAAGRPVPPHIRPAAPAEPLEETPTTSRIAGEARAVLDQLLEDR